MSLKWPRGYGINKRRTSSRKFESCLVRSTTLSRVHAHPAQSRFLVSSRFALQVRRRFAGACPPPSVEYRVQPSGGLPTRKAARAPRQARSARPAARARRPAGRLISHAEGRQGIGHFLSSPSTTMPAPLAGAPGRPGRAPLPGSRRPHPLSSSIPHACEARARPGSLLSFVLIDLIFSIR